MADRSDFRPNASMRVAAIVVFALCGCQKLLDLQPVSADPIDAAGPHLLLHYSFDDPELLVDSAGNHATSCTVCPTAAPGRIGSAASFAGAACAVIQDAPELHPDAFTFALWLEPRGAQIATAFSRPLNGVASSNNTIEMFTAPTGNWYVAVGGHSVATLVGSDEWHHIAAVFDGATLTLYVDGSAIAPTTTTTVTYAVDHYRIGCDLDFDTEVAHLTGLVDDLRLYDGPLDADAIASLAAM